MFEDPAAVDKLVAGALDTPVGFDNFNLQHFAAQVFQEMDFEQIACASQA